MIIDTHTHLVQNPFDLVSGLPPRTARKPFALADSALAQFRQCGVTSVWACTTEGLVDETAPYNRFLSRLARRHPGFVVPFCTVNPHRGRHAVTEFRDAVLKRGMRGLKFHPWLQAVSCMSVWMERLVEEAGRLGVPVMFHDGTPPYATPLQIARLAEKFPRTTIVLGHSGLQDLYPDAVRAARRNPNILLSTCSASYDAIRLMLDKIGPDRILVGTDGGVGDVVGLVEFYQDMIDALGLSPADRDKILWQNAVRVIGPRAIG